MVKIKKCYEGEKVPCDSCGKYSPDAVRLVFKIDEEEGKFVSTVLCPECVRLTGMMINSMLLGNKN